MPRIHCSAPLTTGATVALPDGAARHVQVLRMQPGETVTLFDGRGGQFEAVIARMGRSEVLVQVGAHDASECEAAVAVHLALGMPANERMDWLVEKATELGAASIQPLLTERTVLRLAGERAAKKQAHWQAIAVAACEQCGRNRVPLVHPVQTLAGWNPPEGAARWMLSLAAGAQPLADALAGVPGDGLAQRANARSGASAPGAGSPAAGVVLLSGPEGGLAAAEEAAARALQFAPVSLGARVLRAETAPLAVLAALTLGA